MFITYSIPFSYSINLPVHTVVLKPNLAELQFNQQADSKRVNKYVFTQEIYLQHGNFKN